MTCFRKWCAPAADYLMEDVVAAQVLSLLRYSETIYFGTVY